MSERAQYGHRVGLRFRCYIGAGRPEAQRVGRGVVVQRAVTAVREYEVGQEPAKIAGPRCGHCRVQRRLWHRDRGPSTNAPLQRDNDSGKDGGDKTHPQSCHVAERAKMCAAVWEVAYTASRLRLKALTDKGIADAYAANPAAQQRLADGLSSSMHQAITDVGVADAFSANPSAPTNLTTTLGFPRHHPRHQS